MGVGSDDGLGGELRRHVVTPNDAHSQRHAVGSIAPGEHRVLEVSQVRARCQRSQQRRRRLRAGLCAGLRSGLLRLEANVERRVVLATARRQGLAERSVDAEGERVDARHLKRCLGRLQQLHEGAQARLHPAAPHWHGRCCGGVSYRRFHSHKAGTTKPRQGVSFHGCRTPHPPAKRARTLCNGGRMAALQTASTTRGQPWPDPSRRHRRCDL